MRPSTILLAISAATLASPAAGAPSTWRSVPTAGTHAYRYEVHEINGPSTHGYRTDFRLKSDGKGGLIAEIAQSATYDGKTYTPVSIDAACAKAMGAGPGRLASVRLSPLSAEQAKLGDAFLASCAPAAVFLPLTDILNVALIQSSDRFHAADLRSIGQANAFAGFSTSLDRAGIAMQESSDRGQTSLASLEGGHATIDWKPDPAKLDLVEQNGGQPVKLDGTEHFAFRLVVDARSGWLERADSLYDDLDMAVAIPNVPSGTSPRVAIKRIVSIEPLPN